jgi:hypothetical protein
LFPLIWRRYYQEERGAVVEEEGGVMEEEGAVMEEEGGAVGSSFLLGLIFHHYNTSIFQFLYILL